MDESHIFYSNLPIHHIIHMFRFFFQTFELFRIFLIFLKAGVCWGKLFNYIFRNRQVVAVAIGASLYWV